MLILMYSYTKDIHYFIPFILIISQNKFSIKKTRKTYLVSGVDNNDKRNQLYTRKIKYSKFNEKNVCPTLAECLLRNSERY